MDHVMDFPGHSAAKKKDLGLWESHVLKEDSLPEAERESVTIREARHRAFWMFDRDVMFSLAMGFRKKQQ